MSYLYVLICRVDDEANPDRMTELHRFDLPTADLEQMRPETALDEMEARALAVGREMMRHLLRSQWPGPEIQPGQVVAAVDDVSVNRRPFPCSQDQSSVLSINQPQGLFFSASSVSSVSL